MTRNRMKKLVVGTLALATLVLSAVPAEAHPRQRMRDKSKASSRPYYQDYQRAEQPWERCHKAAQQIDYPIWAQGWSIECVDGPVVEGRQWLGVCRCWPGMHWSQVRIRVDASARHSNSTVAFVLAHEVAHAHFAIYEPERFNDQSGRADERAADRWAYEHLRKP